MRTTIKKMNKMMLTILEITALITTMMMMMMKMVMMNNDGYDVNIPS